MTILDELANTARDRVAVAKLVISAEEMKSRALSMPKGSFEFECAINKPEMAFICECKKASPSKSIIAEDFPYLDIACDYETAGADCISVLTEPSRFLGKPEYLKEISAGVTIPCLRKDFVVDEYMIYEAKVLGAKAVLLICAILSDKELSRYIAICDRLGISALVEAHDEVEIKRGLLSGARVIGVNNRDLKDFSVNPSNSMRLREKVPKGALFVSESGIKTADDVKVLYDAGVDAVLIGETLMRAEDKKAKLAELKSKLNLSRIYY